MSLKDQRHELIEQKRRDYYKRFGVRGRIESIRLRIAIKVFRYLDWWTNLKTNHQNIAFCLEVTMLGSILAIFLFIMTIIGPLQNK